MTTVKNASETIENIQGIEVHSWTAEVDDGGIMEYKTTVEVSFPVEETVR